MNLKEIISSVILYSLLVIANVYGITMLATIVEGVLYVLFVTVVIILSFLIWGIYTSDEYIIEQIFDTVEKNPEKILVNTRKYVISALVMIAEATILTYFGYTFLFALFIVFSAEWYLLHIYMKGVAESIIKDKENG